jgi:hypothetical protein
MALTTSKGKQGNKIKADKDALDKFRESLSKLDDVCKVFRNELVWLAS